MPVEPGGRAPGGGACWAPAKKYTKLNPLLMNTNRNTFFIIWMLKIYYNIWSLFLRDSKNRYNLRDTQSR
jgi:hypothetical protein